MIKCSFEMAHSVYKHRSLEELHANVVNVLSVRFRHSFIAFFRSDAEIAAAMHLTMPARFGLLTRTAIVA